MGYFAVRRRFLAFLAGGLGAIARSNAEQPDEFEGRILDFHRAWDEFMRAYFGCSKDAGNLGDCDASKRRLDYGLFLKAAKRGRKLFDQEK